MLRRRARPSPIRRSGAPKPSSSQARRARRGWTCQPRLGGIRRASARRARSACPLRPSCRPYRSRFLLGSPTRPNPGRTLPAHPGQRFHASGSCAPCSRIAHGLRSRIRIGSHTRPFADPRRFHACRRRCALSTRTRVGASGSALPDRRRPGLDQQRGLTSPARIHRPSPRPEPDCAASTPSWLVSSSHRPGPKPGRGQSARLRSRRRRADSRGQTGASARTVAHPGGASSSPRGTGPGRPTDRAGVEPPRMRMGRSSRRRSPHACGQAASHADRTAAAGPDPSDRGRAVMHAGRTQHRHDR